MGGIFSSKTKTDTSSWADIPQNFQNLMNRTLNFADTALDSVFEAFTGPRIAQLSSNEQQGIQRASSSAGMYQNVLDAASQNALEMAAQRGIPGQNDLNAFMNPYIDNVLDRSLGRLRDQFDINNVNIGSQAGMQGAFGSTRHGVLEGANLAELLKSTGDISSRTYADAFDKGMSSWFRGQDLRRGNIADLLNTSLTGQQYNQGDINALMQTGGTERIRDQAQLDFNFSEFLRKLQDPFTKANFAGSVMQQYPTDLFKRNQTTTTTSTPSPFSQVAGLAMSAAGLMSGNPAALAGLGAGQQATQAPTNIIPPAMRNTAPPVNLDQNPYQLYNRGGPVKNYKGGGFVQKFDEGGFLDRMNNPLTQLGLSMIADPNTSPLEHAQLIHSRKEKPQEPLFTLDDLKGSFEDLGDTLGFAKGTKNKTLKSKFTRGPLSVYFDSEGFTIPDVGVGPDYANELTDEDIFDYALKKHESAADTYESPRYNANYWREMKAAGKTPNNSHAFGIAQWQPSTWNALVKRSNGRLKPITGEDVEKGNLPSKEEQDIGYSLHKRDLVAAQGKNFAGRWAEHQAGAGGASKMAKAKRNTLVRNVIGDEAARNINAYGETVQQYYNRVNRYQKEAENYFKKEVPPGTPVGVPRTQARQGSYYKSPFDAIMYELAQGMNARPVLERPVYNDSQIDRRRKRNLWETSVGRESKNTVNRFNGSNVLDMARIPFDGRTGMTSRVPLKAPKEPVDLYDLFASGPSQKHKPNKSYLDEYLTGKEPLFNTDLDKFFNSIREARLNREINQDRQDNYIPASQLRKKAMEYEQHKRDMKAERKAYGIPEPDPFDNYEHSLEGIEQFTDEQIDKLSGDNFMGGRKVFSYAKGSKKKPLKITPEEVLTDVLPHVAKESKYPVYLDEIIDQYASPDPPRKDLEMNRVNVISDFNNTTYRDDPRWASKQVLPLSDKVGSNSVTLPLSKEARRRASPWQDFKDTAYNDPWQSLGDYGLMGRLGEATTRGLASLVPLAATPFSFLPQGVDPAVLLFGKNIYGNKDSQGNEQYGTPVNQVTLKNPTEIPEDPRGDPLGGDLVVNFDNSPIDDDPLGPDSLINGTEEGSADGTITNAANTAFKNRDDEISARLNELLLKRIGDLEKESEPDTDPLRSIFGDYNKGLFDMGMNILANSDYPNSGLAALGKGILGSKASEEQKMLSANERRNQRLKDILNTKYMSAMISSMSPENRANLERIKGQYNIAEKIIEETAKMNAQMGTQEHNRRLELLKAALAQAPGGGITPEQRKYFEEHKEPYPFKTDTSSILDLE